MEPERNRNHVRPITSTKNQNFDKKNLPSSKIPVPDGFTGEFYPKFRELTPVLLKLFQKITEGGTLPNSVSEATIMLTPKPNKDIFLKKENITDEHKCTNPE